MAKLSITTEGPTAGIWIENDKGDRVGVVAEDRGAAYLMIKDGKSQYPLVLSTDASHVPQVQIPGRDGGAFNMRIVSIEKILELLKA